MRTQRHLHVVLCLALVLASVVACSNSGEEMRRQLNELQARNQADSLMTDDSLALTLCNYFDSHGTPNEQMLAHYLLARTYADMGEAPMALDEFHHAADCADTTAADCDYRLLAKIHAQTTNIFSDQMMPQEMLAELGMMEYYSQKCNDSVYQIIAIEWQHCAYEMLGDTVNSILIIKKAYEDYLQLGRKDMASNCLPALIGYLVNTHNLVEARYYLEKYEEALSLIQNTDNPSVPGIYNYFKGNYYSAINILDSAEYCYRQELASQELNDIEASYSGLYKLYKSLGKTDSVAKYADLCYQISEDRFKQYNSEELGHMQALYNYTRNQSLAIKKAKEADRNFKKFLFTGCLGVLLVIVFSVVIFKNRQRKRSEIKRLKKEYSNALEQQELARQELVLLQRQEFETLLGQKQNEINEHQKKIENIEKLLYSEKSLETQLVNTDIYRRFVYLAQNYHKNVYVDDWRNLYLMMDTVLPNFRTTLSSMTHLSDKDYRLCILIRLHFSLSEISILLSENSVYLSRRRKYLLSKLFNQEGKPEKFDSLIKSIS